MDWFLYDKGIHHERVNTFRLITDLSSHPFLELETSCLEIDSSLCKLAKWLPLRTLSLPLVD